MKRVDHDGASRSVQGLSGVENVCVEIGGIFLSYMSCFVAS